ncbi:transcriptional regulator family: Fungal Specific TF [Paecilomyces variotii]|uniref:Fungal-specific transcription factor domain-containing protein n=1 Tax=Byssochlamys spectabilis TaxID=264951 RepID=A0A443I7Q9_BYSSP|nr:fungal-specific transcription factor domain-containing protein [Paecilomyces variotii]KAJ9209436.1 transcriptional regulator family: Fungal Specific TF [Paecilomyces variotii]KAJ9221815.1 transcriptional regulator family: Fungal Specific TF [Paecilomyces variotii]KAJ9228664.1 transcriptional regulator family: Fungal Specific TF [Paecilomyces variotii]KAJ9247931.1 transcriptional regulator family: Fungal Specific TF [Paecilomyces variotii]KAJ9288507.1 transcriptional regulator family: Fungal
MASSNTPRAENSCRRCHRRKKKCDRSLPQCEACERAGSKCSFLDERNQIGSFPLSYVQSLQRRVKDLERQLSLALSTSRNSEDSIYLDPNNGSSPPLETFTPDRPTTEEIAVPFIPASATNNLSPTVGTRGRAHSLASELELLSLSATAERYLGSSSGVSFAKLTQAVLRRLSPDKSSFVFEDDIEQKGSPNENQILDQFIDPLSFRKYGPSSLISSSSAFRTFPELNQQEQLDVVELELPPQWHAAHLTDFYWSHSHTLYPIIRKNEFMGALWKIYTEPEDPLMQSPLWLFRVWMVLAIGSTAYCSVSLVDESESVMFFNKAMTYFEDAFSCGDMAALEVLMLQVSYSFFNQLGPNTWFLVGVATRMAIGMGLHTSSTYENIPVDVSEYRKRIFWSLYMMDRVVSMALGRPFAMRDEDIDVEIFADVDDENIRTDRIVPQDPLQPSSMQVPRHILALRKIASVIGEKVYSQTKARGMDQGQRDEVIRQIHKQLVEWRRSMPFPLPELQGSRVPHLSSSWFDLNYYTHVTMLYRPSPLCPILDVPKVKILAESSAMSIRQATNMHLQQRLSYNWLNLFGVFTSSLALMYSVTAQPDSLSSALEQTGAIGDLELAVELLGTFGKKFPSALKCQSMIREVVSRLKDHLVPRD